MSACIEWVGARDRFGYGRRGVRLAHRMVYEECFGPIPPGFHLHHTCQNRACVNPEHLEVLTPAEHAKVSYWALKPACKYGHEFTVENTRIDSRGRRHCRTCRRELDATRNFSIVMRDLLWSVAQHKYGWAYTSRRQGQRQVADGLVRRGWVEYDVHHDREHREPIIVATEAGRAEVARRWPISPFILGTYEHQSAGWTPREGVPA